MIALILAAGYATRLYPLTKTNPKPLLLVREKPIIEYIMGRISELKPSAIYVIVNAKFISQFARWSKGKKGIVLINDGTRSDAGRLGAIGDINFAIDKRDIKEDILLIGGDNLFEFGLKGFLNFAQEKVPSVTVGLYDVGRRNLAGRFGVVELDGKRRIIGFEEKPSRPATSLVSMCVYFFPSSKFKLLKKYLAEGNNPDAPGNFIRWLYKREPVYGYALKGVWFDIGTLEAYKKANKEERLI